MFKLGGWRKSKDASEYDEYGKIENLKSSIMQVSNPAPLRSLIISTNKENLNEQKR